MSQLSIRNLLTSKGYEREVIKKVEYGTTIITRYYTKDGICIIHLTIGDSKHVLSFYDKWNITEHCGHCEIYDTTIEVLQRIA